MIVFVPVVEGHGEVQAVPVLLHRLAQNFNPAQRIRANPPIRVKSGSFLNDDAYFRRQMSLAAAKAAQSQGYVLILLDCEDDCPARPGPELLRRARAVRADVEVGVFLAYREYETWFIAAAESLRGQAGLAADLRAPDDPQRFGTPRAGFRSECRPPTTPSSINWLSPVYSTYTRHGAFSPSAV